MCVDGVNKGGMESVARGGVVSCCRRDRRDGLRTGGLCGHDVQRFLRCLSSERLVPTSLTCALSHFTVPGVVVVSRLSSGRGVV